jgi:hypothetical protein
MTMDNDNDVETRLQRVNAVESEFLGLRCGFQPGLSLGYPETRLRRFDSQKITDYRFVPARAPTNSKRSSLIARSASK